VSAPKKIVEEYFELKFIECGHRIRSTIPAHSGSANHDSSSESTARAISDSGSGSGAAPARSRFPDASVVPVPGTCPACQDFTAEPPP
jgi:hypothetical protein